jgi:hypothetical protein
LCTAPALNGKDGPAIARMQDLLLDLAIETVIESDN